MTDEVINQGIKLRNKIKEINDVLYSITPYLHNDIEITVQKKVLNYNGEKLYYRLKYDSPLWMAIESSLKDMRPDYQKQFDEHGRFNLPSLLAAMETQDRKKEIDALAETIEGADLLRDFISNSWSCSHHTTEYCWFAAGDKGFAYGFYLGHSCLVVPTILYR